MSLVIIEIVGSWTRAFAGSPVAAVSTNSFSELKSTHTISMSGNIET
jgi:hypothetical protein